MMKRMLAFLLLVLSVNFSVTGQAINKAKLDSFLNVLSLNNKCMGSLAISQNGMVYQKAVGYITADRDVKNLANIKTKYRIGSISKIFTGVILFQLIEEGKITLETTLDKYYPQLPNAAKITIGQCLVTIAAYLT